MARVISLGGRSAISASQVPIQHSAESLTPDENDDAMMGLSLGQLDEVVTVAGHHQAVMVVRELQDERIGRLQRKHIAQPQEFVAGLSNK